MVLLIVDTMLVLPLLYKYYFVAMEIIDCLIWFLFFHQILNKYVSWYLCYYKFRLSIDPVYQFRILESPGILLQTDKSLKVRTHSWEKKYEQKKIWWRFPYILLENVIPCLDKVFENCLLNPDEEIIHSFRLAMFYTLPLVSIYSHIDPILNSPEVL